MQCSWKVPVLPVLLIKISNVWQKSKSCQSKCPILKIQDVLHRTRTCLTENYPVWHDVSFYQTECLTSYKSFQEVCNVSANSESYSDQELGRWTFEGLNKVWRQTSLEGFPTGSILVVLSIIIWYTLPIMTLLTASCFSPLKTKSSDSDHGSLCCTALFHWNVQSRSRSLAVVLDPQSVTQRWISLFFGKFWDNISGRFKPCAMIVNSSYQSLLYRLIHIESRLADFPGFTLFLFTLALPISTH